MTLKSVFLLLGVIGSTLAISCYRETALPTLTKGDSTECVPGCEFCVTHRIIKTSGVQIERHCGCGDSNTLLGSLVNCKGEGVFPYQLMDATITKTCCRGDFCNGAESSESVATVVATQTTTTTTLKPIELKSLPPIPIIVPTVITIQPVLPDSSVTLSTILPIVIAFITLFY
ncbi:unnamed protein product, partial [Mesorhabditis belari]|uniref:UPAR/Ly6 domain-containing protein n=1 Tax=Mesorhabditis belari TaxID=2138241 RepID=A0AAF3J4E1_9BILA